MDNANETAAVPSGYTMLPHGMGLVKKASSPGTVGMPGAASGDNVVVGHCAADNGTAGKADDASKPKIGAGEVKDGADEGAGRPSQSRYSLRRRGRNVGEQRAQSNAQVQSHLLLKVTKPVIIKQDNATADETHPPKASTTTIAAERQKLRPKRIPLKERTPYHKNSTVPWGETPFHKHTGPLAAECERVFELLKEQHANGKLNFIRPAKIPPPSLEVAGCGETPLLVDGLARTVLSGSTNMKNANNAIQQVVEYYGTVTKSAMVDGEEITPVKNCIDWDRVRREGEQKFGEVIKCGGLQNVGSKAVLSILDKCHASNAERASAFQKEKDTGVSADVPGADALTQSQKDMEIWMFENSIISLEHLRALPVETVMNELVQFHGVGIKTAACVILFCLQEPCFAVDTHCFRIPQWLGWIPPELKENSDRGKAFAHLDLRIPDHLKYGLHQLFIEHGQNCYRCRSATREGTKDWEECACPLEELLDRSITKKTGKAAGRKRQAAEMEADKGGDYGDEAGDPETSGHKDVVEAVLNPALNGGGEVEGNVGPARAKQAPPRGPRRKQKTDDDEDCNQNATSIKSTKVVTMKTERANISTTVPDDDTQVT